MTSLLLNQLIGLVFEDAPAGVISGKAAGCTVVAVLGTHSRESLEQAKPDFILDDFSQYVFSSQHTENSAR